MADEAVEAIFVKVDGVDNESILFPFDSTLDLVADRFEHERSLGYIDFKMTTGVKIFAALPLSTRLHTLRQWGSLKGNGSLADPYIVRVERSGAAGRGWGCRHGRVRLGVEAR